MRETRQLRFPGVAGALSADQASHLSARSFPGTVNAHRRQAHPGNVLTAGGVQLPGSCATEVGENILTIWSGVGLRHFSVLTDGTTDRDTGILP